MNINLRARLLNTAFFLFAVFAALFLSACTSLSHKKTVEELSRRYSVPDDRQLIVYTSHKEEVYLPIIREFEKTTGINVEIHAGGTAELLSKIRESGGNGSCDIMFGGGIASLEAQKDLFMPYETTDRGSIDPGYLSPDDLWTPFTELPLVIVYNKKLLSASEAPASWSDLLDTKWKGRIAFADIHNSGTSYTILSTISQITGTDAKTLVPEFIDLLDGKLVSSSGQIIPGVSNGTYLVGVTLEETALKALETGSDIAIVYPSDGTSALPDGCAIVKNAPHSYNAGLFIDFVVNRDTQEYATEMFLRRPVRTDVSLPEAFVVIDKTKFDMERAAREEENFFELWDEILKQKEAE